MSTEPQPETTDKSAREIAASPKEEGPARGGHTWHSVDESADLAQVMYRARFSLTDHLGVEHAGAWVDFPLTTTARTRPTREQIVQHLRDTVADCTGPDLYDSEWERIAEGVLALLDDHADRTATTDMKWTLADYDTLPETTTSTTDELREQVDRAVGGVLWNASNHPDPVAVLGRDLGPMRTKVVDAVMGALATARTRPIREQIAFAIARGVDGVTSAEYEDASDDYRNEMLEGADAVLALLNEEAGR